MGTVQVRSDDELRRGCEVIASQWTDVSVAAVTLRTGDIDHQVGGLVKSGGILACRSIAEFVFKPERHRRADDLRPSDFVGHAWRPSAVDPFADFRVKEAADKYMAHMTWTWALGGIGIPLPHLFVRTHHVLVDFVNAIPSDAQWAAGLRETGQAAGDRLEAAYSLSQ